MTDTTAPADEREAFEAALEMAYGPFPTDKDELGRYADNVIEGAWWAWQARAASQPAQEPVALKRWGVKWKGQTEPFMEQMPDGYWTPWHIAQQAIAAPPADTARADRFEAALRSIAANTCCDRCQEEALVARAALEREVRKP